MMFRYLVIITLLICIANSVQFPITPIGQCYDGVKILMDENAYPGARIAYWGPNISAGESSNIPGHVELILPNGTYIDPHYGIVLDSRSPGVIFDNMSQLDKHITRVIQINNKVTEHCYEEN
jgi:hypothetical protein